MSFTVKIKDNKIFIPVKNAWILVTPKEKIKQEFICRLINEQSYILDQIDQDIKLNTDANYKADICIWKSKEDKEKNNIPEIIIAIEIKPEYLKIKEEDFKKGYIFAKESGANIFVATNAKETKIYRINYSINKKLERIRNFPSAEIIKDKKKLKEFFIQSKEYTREKFSRVLSRCHNIIRNIDKLSPEAAFDEISKILFMKIRYERKKRGEKLFTLKELNKIQNEKQNSINLQSGTLNQKFIDGIFQDTKQFFQDDELFDNNEVIRIRNTSFSLIVKELEVFNLSNISDDIKGVAFENFLGRTFRGELGQFFTPRTVVDFMVDILDPEEGEVICDPACGSGGFLIKAFEFIREKIENSVNDTKKTIKEQIINTKNVNKKCSIQDIYQELDREFDSDNQQGRLYNISHNCFFGTDANPRMARTAKMNMIMHGDGHGGIYHNDGLLDVGGIFENHFDVIFTNPPFGSHVSRSLLITESDFFMTKDKINRNRKLYGKEYEQSRNQFRNYIGEPLANLFESGKISNLTEVLFIERCLKLLKPGGRMGIVLPEGVLNNTNLQKVRDLFVSQAKILLIVSIPKDVFIASGATIKPSLLFFKKFTENEHNKWNEIKENVTIKINEKYKDEINSINEKIALNNKIAPSKEEKKVLRKKLTKLKQKISEEINNQIKHEFDYEIPIAEIKKAGITSTGAVCDNELKPLAKEFTKYRKKHKLWEEKKNSFSYEIIDNKLFKSIASGKEQILQI